LRTEKICIFIRALKAGGAEKQSLLLAKVLKEEFDVFLLVQNGNDPDNRYLRFARENRIKLIMPEGTQIARLAHLYTFFRKNEIHLIFSFLTSDNFWSAILGKLTGVRFLVGSIRNEQLPGYKEYITRLLQKYMLDYIIFNSYSGLNSFIRKGFVPQKSLVIHNCIEITSPVITREKKNKIKILTVARFVPQKDLYTALKAVWYLKKLLVREPMDIEYDIVGFGKQEAQIKKWITEYDLSKNVRLIIHPENLTEYFEEADIYLSTSLFEGLSNSILEALSYSLPVVATDVGDNQLIVKNRVNGYIVPVGEYQEIAQRLSELVDSYEKRISFGLNGYKLLEKNFSMSKFRDEYIRLIHSRIK